MAPPSPPRTQSQQDVAADDPDRQGISHVSAALEAPGRENEIRQREDVQAQVNHSDKVPQR